MRRVGRLLISILCVLPRPAEARDEPTPTLEWTVIDLDVQLDKDGRFHVVETHHLRIGESGSFSVFREFGLGVDQSIAFGNLTRVDADGTEHPLKDAEVTAPDLFRYYDLGHAYFRTPELAKGTEISYRFDYEIVNAVSPAWGISAGPEPLLERPDIVNPWTRLKQVVADAREAWPERQLHRYRLDHDVLYPSRDGPGYVVRRIHYRIAYDRAWKEVHPEADLAKVKFDVDYRVRPLLDYVGDSRPPATSWNQAATRLAAAAALPVVGLVFWLIVVCVEAIRMRLSGRVDRAFIVKHLLPLSPEVVPPSVDGYVEEVPTAAEVLARLATERKLSILAETPVDPEKGRTEIQVRLLVPMTSLPAFESEFLQDFLAGASDARTDRLRHVWKEKKSSPDEKIQTLLAQAVPPSVGWWSVLNVISLLVLAGGVFLQLHDLKVTEAFPFILMADALAFVIAILWPRRFWHGGRSSLLLLLPFVVFSLGSLTLQLMTNRPFPPDTWIGTTAFALACGSMTLFGAPMPTRGAYANVRPLVRIRRFAAGELKRAAPRLEDPWIPQLIALGLGRALESWRARHGDSALAVPDLSETGGVETGPRFTGRVPIPFQGPAGWQTALEMSEAS